MNNEEKFKSLLNISFPTECVPDTNIPVFSPPSEETKQTNKYHKDFEIINRYVGLFAFSHILRNGGGAEGLYRTINCALLTNFDRSAENTVLDLGCGVGRTLYDCAELFPNSFFIGMDYAYGMCQRAKEILLDGSVVNLEEALSYTGFDSKSFELSKTKKLENVYLSQGSALELPFKQRVFDCVINTYLIDRVDDPTKAVSEMARVLKKDGLFVLSTPLNFQTYELRSQFPDASKLQQMIEEQGIKVVESFDGLIYREIKDIRGNYEDFLSFVFIGRKK